MSFWKIFVGFVGDALNAILNDFLEPLDRFLGQLLHASFFIEDLPGLENTFLSGANIQQAFYATYGLLTLLLVLKLLWKGTKVYILWRDGEAETDPGEMLLGAVYAIVVTAFFPVLYVFAVEGVQVLVDVLSDALFPDKLLEFSGVWEVLDKIIGAGGSMVLVALVYVVMLIILMFSMVKQGAEMLIYRLGIPLASIGLVNADGGVWKPYAQSLFRQMATAAIRFMCISLGMRLCLTQTLSGLIGGIAFEAVAIKTPALLSQFLAPKSGGGAAQKINTVVMAVRAFGGH